MTRVIATSTARFDGAALRIALAAPRNVARRAYGFVAWTRAAVSAIPSAAACPAAGPPSRTPLRIAYVTSAADVAACSVTVRGSARWSTKRIVAPSIRNAVRKTGSLSAGGAATVAGGGATACSRRAGSRIAPASSADVRWRAWAAPTIVAAVDAISPANWRKNRRRAMSAPPSAGPAGEAGPAACPGSAAGPAADVTRPSSEPGSVALVAVGSAMVRALTIASLGVGGSVLDDARDAASVEAVAALQEVELDEERQPDDLALEPLHELDRALDRAAGRE